MFIPITKDSLDLGAVHLDQTHGSWAEQVPLRSDVGRTIELIRQRTNLEDLATHEAEESANESDEVQIA